MSNKVKTVVVVTVVILAAVALILVLFAENRVKSNQDKQVSKQIEIVK